MAYHLNNSHLLQKCQEIHLLVVVGVGVVDSEGHAAGESSFQSLHEVEELKSTQVMLPADRTGEEVAMEVVAVVVIPRFKHSRKALCISALLFHGD